MRISVLIVEDDIEASSILRSLLALKIPEIGLYLAENGRMGLQISSEHKPDIVITDINMPDIDGISMVRAIREMKPDTKFIVITGYSNKMEEFGDIEIHDYFVKPTDLRKLLGSIERCIREIGEAR